MILEDIVKELANRINQPHVIRTYLLKVRDTAYKLGIEEGKKQCGLAGVVEQSGQLFCPSCESTDIDTEFNHYNLCRNCNYDWEK